MPLATRQSCQIMEKDESQSVRLYRINDIMPEEAIKSSPNSTQRSVIFNTFIAKLTHYVSPGDFYVKNINDEELLTKIKYKIQHFKHLKRLDFEFGVSVPDNDHEGNQDDHQDNPEINVHVKIGDLVLAPWISDLYSDDLGELAPYHVSLRRAKIKSKKVCPEMGMYLKVIFQKNYNSFFKIIFFSEYVCHF